MGVPYETPPQVAEAVAGPTVIEVDWPDRSVISKIIVVTTEGTGEAFSVALYNHPQVESDEVSSDSIGPDVGRVPDDLYRITPDLVANAAGKLIYFSDQATGGSGYMVFGQARLDGRQGQRQRKIWLKITPVTNTPRKFGYVIGGMKEVE